MLNPGVNQEMKCPKCGLEIPDNSNFCKHCGEALTVQGHTSTGRMVAGETPPAGTNFVTPAAPLSTGPEKTLWEEYPSMRTLFPALALWILLFVILLLVYTMFLPAESRFMNAGTDVGMLIILGVGLLVVIGSLLRHFVRLRSTHYRLTNERMFVTHGIFSKRTEEVELEKYKDIFVNQDFWDKVVGCGDIQVVTSDVTNPTVNIIDVVDPIGKKELIRRCARERQLALGMTRREEL